MMFSRTTVALLLAGFLLVGCVATDAVTTAPPQPSQPQADTVQVVQSPPVQLEQHTDTITTASEVVHAQADTATEIPPEVRFTVQIGAYRDPGNAGVALNLARDRFHLPVLNEFNPLHGLYQIRVGFFQQRDAALRFLQTMQHDYPEEYKDSWVAQLKP